MGNFFVICVVEGGCFRRCNSKFAAQLKCIVYGGKRICYLNVLVTTLW